MRKFFVSLFAYILSLFGCGGGSKDYDVGYIVKPDGIYKNGQKIMLYGLNWFGLETCIKAPHGLEYRTVDDYMKIIKQYGFNALRLPVSLDVIKNDGVVDREHVKADVNYPERPLDGFLYVLDKAKENGLYVVIDFHNFNCNDIDKYLEGYIVDKQAWFDALTKLAEISKNYDNVVAIDIFNEPYKLTWDEWKELFMQALLVVMKVNSNLLLFVQGIGNNDEDVKDYPVFWGENLSKAEYMSNKIVFTPHVYSPSYALQPYFKSLDLLPEVWDMHFGHLYYFALGEFGSKFTDADKQWEEIFIEYMKKKGVNVWFYWALNGDTDGGFFTPDWQNVNQTVVEFLNRLKF